MTSRVDESGQAVVFLAGVLAAVLVGAVVLGAVARGIGVQGRQQRAADLGALAGARAMRDGYARLFEPAVMAGAANSAHLEGGSYLERGRAAAVAAARANGAREVSVAFPDGDDGLPATRIVVTVSDDVESAGRRVKAGAVAEAELALPGSFGVDGAPVNAGEYPGPFAYRSGKPMRPDTALAFDRMAAAAGRDGVSLIVVSGFRSDAEQAVLFAAHPDPKWVAPPGKSLHRLGTELDLGPPAAYAWLYAHSRQFGFVKRYDWEPWHFGLNRSAGTTKLGYGSGRYSADRRTSLPAFVPSQYAPALAKAAMRWNVSATLLAAQLYQESGFNPFARSSAGALGIAQFMPGTAASYGLSNPYDAYESINAQGHLMHDLLRQFASVPLALAAYNAGPAPVQACGCVPAIPETQGYVAAILALMRGAGDPAGAAIGGLEVRLVR